MNASTGYADALDTLKPVPYSDKVTYPGVFVSEMDIVVIVASSVPGRLPAALLDNPRSSAAKSRD
jgi:hypothetical protein